MTTAVLLVAGLLLLLLGAEVMIRGAARLAAATGLSPLVVGLTVVALGTSAPELAISLDAALRGAPDIALGNVVGSNIANVLLILGASALVAPLVVARQLVRLDVPVMVAASLLVLVMAGDGRISRTEGAVLLVASLVYTVVLVRLGRRAAAQGEPVAGTSGATGEASPGTWWWNLLLVLAGLALLVLGARWLVQAAVAVASGLGVSQLVIGLTVVAVGTSLPEIATSVLATLRGQRDIAVGNVVGSNVFNLSVVLGGAATVAPGGVPVGTAARGFDLPVMAAVAFACLPIVFASHRINRWEGGVFLAYYAAYAAYLVLDSAGHDALPLFSALMMEFVIPLTAITLGVLAWRAWRARTPHDHEEQSP